MHHTRFGSLFGNSHSGTGLRLDALIQTMATSSGRSEVDSRARLRMLAGALEGDKSIGTGAAKKRRASSKVDQVTGTTSPTTVRERRVRKRPLRSKKDGSKSSPTTNTLRPREHWSDVGKKTQPGDEDMIARLALWGRYEYADRACSGSMSLTNPLIARKAESWRICSRRGRQGGFGPGSSSQVIRVVAGRGYPHGW